MTLRWAPLILAAAGLFVLLRYGGGNDTPTTAVIGVALLGAACVATAVEMRRFATVPTLLPVLVVFVPATLVVLVQAIPWGWCHPWVRQDAALLGGGTGSWSINAQATWDAVVWMLALGATAVLVAIHGRNARAWTAVQWLVGIAAVHAATGVVLAIVAPDWPAAMAAGRVRGTFVYSNHAASFWGACLPLALICAATSRKRWIWFAAAALGLGVVLSASRGGIITTALVTIPFGWRLLPERRRWLYALGLGLAITGYVALIGADLTREKFGRLVDDHGISGEGLTLTGRTFMWESSVPLALEAGPLGSGAGTTVLAFPRTGNIPFANHQVDMLHCDPLQWWLELGWLGLGIAAAGVIGGLWQLRRPKVDVGRRLGAVRCGAGAGLMVLGLHCLVDFTWHNPAASLLGAVFIGLLAASMLPQDMQLSRRTLSVRLGLYGCSVALLTGAWLTWPGAVAYEQAFTGGKYLYGRLKQGESWDVSSPALTGIEGPAHSIDLALLKARVALADPAAPGARERAQEALSEAAKFVPGHGEAWIERARLATMIDPVANAPVITLAIDRALNWAPASPYIQIHALWCLSRIPAERIGQDRAIRLIQKLLAVDLEQPAWFFQLAERHLGSAALGQRLVDGSGLSLLRSALPWLAEHGACDHWQAALRRLESQNARNYAASQWSTVQQLGLGTDGLDLPRSSDERAECAARLDEAGLPLPLPLAEFLRQDGPPWAWWIEGGPLRSTGQGEGTTTDADNLHNAILQQHLWRPWVRRWWHLANRLHEARHGVSSELNGDDDPRLLVIALESASALERKRLSGLLEAYRSPQWRDLPGARWTWLMVTSPTTVIESLPTWTGVVIDGRWQGWERGTCDLGSRLGPGLHHIVLINL